jgi:hypothetical protein
VIGLDTNVLVRYIMQDEIKQSSLATRIVESLTAMHNAIITRKTLFAMPVLFALLLPTLGYADCEGTVHQVSKTLNYPQDDSVRYFANCKIWPADPSKTIVALAYFQAGSYFSSPPDEGEGLYDLDILIVSTASGDILQRLFQKGALASDAIALKKITIDTERYVLAPNKLAFGVRVMRGNPHVDFETLNLYMTRNNDLKSVLAGLITYSLFGEPQGPGGCSRSSETKRTFSVAKTSSQGLANLVVQEKKIEEEQTAVDDTCEIDETKSSQRYVLRFDGTKYLLPKLLHE